MKSFSSVESQEKEWKWRLKAVCNLRKCCLQQQRRGQYCMLFIYIWFIIKHIFFFTNLEKEKKILSCCSWLFLNHPKQRNCCKSFRSNSSISMAFIRHSLYKEKRKKIILSFYFYFALILFDAVSTGQDMLSRMAISLHHMCLSQDSRGRWILAGRELNTSTQEEKKFIYLTPCCLHTFPRCTLTPSAVVQT